MPFSRILTHLLNTVPGCVGTGFVADDGETVQIAGSLESYIHRVHLACQRILLERVRVLDDTDSPDHLICMLDNYCWVIQPLEQGYCLVLTLDARHRVFQAIPEIKKAATLINSDL
jgi:hypothetical protein